MDTMTLNQTDKLEALRAKIEADTLQRFIDYGYDPKLHYKAAIETCIKLGKKYTKIDVGTSGKYMVDQDGNIFGIKAYGVIHFGHQYGTLDTINEWNWGGYTARKIK